MSKNKVEIAGVDTNRLYVLSSEESLDLLKKYRETKSKEYLDELVQGNLKLVLSIVNKYNKKNESSRLHVRDDFLIHISVRIVLPMQNHIALRSIL